jgi:phosphomannomutase
MRQLMIGSISGVRGILNVDITLQELQRFTSRFAERTKSDSFLVGRDTRSTGEAITKALLASLLARGGDVTDLGVVSTPALFRESRVSGSPAIMVTASHNEPQFNGLKFIEAGYGADEATMGAVLSPKRLVGRSFGVGKLRHRSPTNYNDSLVERFGEGSLTGTRVALDLGGGAAIPHAVPVLRRLGCEVIAINDSCGIFNRTIDPTRDDLTALRRMTKERGCAIGLGFDCDGDRLVVVDDRGRKRTGDHMLTLAMSRVLIGSQSKDVVVSVDTTIAIDDVVRRAGGRVFRSKVGEANVVKMMQEKDVEIGGEGSSGGLIDGSFNYCRDSMLAALLIIRALKESGPRFYDSVASYHQVRGALPMPRKKIAKVMTKLTKNHSDADTTDGVKIKLGRNSWVLVRPSNTEDVVRVSAEAESEEKAAEIEESHLRELEGLSG